MKISAGQKRILGSNVQYLLYPFEYFAEAQRALGVEEIELFSSTPHLWCDHYGFSISDVGKIKKELSSAGLAVSVFSPKKYTYSLASDKDSELGRASIAYYENCLELSSMFGAKIICMDIANYCRDYPVSVIINNLRSSLECLLSKAEEIGVFILLGRSMLDEWPILKSPFEYIALLNELKSKNLALFLDVAAVSFRDETLQEWFDVCGSHIRHVRFMDGRYSGYRAWGDGCLPCRSFFDEILRNGYSGGISLFCQGERYYQEPAEADKKSHLWLKEAVFPL